MTLVNLINSLLCVMSVIIWSSYHMMSPRLWYPFGSATSVITLEHAYSGDSLLHLLKSIILWWPVLCIGAWTTVILHGGTLFAQLPGFPHLILSLVFFSARPECFLDKFGLFTPLQDTGIPEVKSHKRKLSSWVIKQTEGTLGESMTTAPQKFSRGLPCHV